MTMAVCTMQPVSTLCGKIRLPLASNAMEWKYDPKLGIVVHHAMPHTGDIGIYKKYVYLTMPWCRYTLNIGFKGVTRLL